MEFERTTAVYILNSDNEILMLNHKKLGVWLPPGGHVEEKELIHEAAIREVLEEAGIEVDFIYESSRFSGINDDRARLLPTPFLVELENLGDHYHEDFVYLARARNSIIHNRENHDMGWFSIEGAMALKVFDNVREQLRYIGIMIVNKEI